MAEVLSASVDVDAVRSRFSSLQQGFAFFDAPGGTQVPDEVGDAMARALREASANLGASYATSIRVGQILEEAEAKAARFLGCEPRRCLTRKRRYGGTPSAEMRCAQWGNPHSETFRKWRRIQ